jgi:hypothetical protein
MDTATAHEILGVRPDAGMAGINAAFHAAAKELDLGSEVGRRRLDQLIEARGRLLDDISSAGDAITLDPADIIELPRPVAAASATGQSEGRSALSDFLDNAIDYEHMGAPLPGTIIKWAVLAAVATMLGGAAMLVRLSDDIDGYPNLRVPGTVLLVLGLMQLPAAFGLRAVRELRGRHMAVAYLVVASHTALPAAVLLLAVVIALVGLTLVGVLGAIVSLGIMYFIILMVAGD